MSDVRIGKLVNTHGVHGEVKVFPLTDHPQRFERLEKVRLVLPKTEENVAVLGVRYHKNHVLLRLEGLDTVEAATLWKNAYLVVPKEERLPLPKDSYYIDDLIGLTVYTDGQAAGTIVDVLQPGANDVYVIRGENQKEWYLPALKSTIMKVDVEAGTMDIVIPDGLLE